MTDTPNTDAVAEETPKSRKARLDYLEDLYLNPHPDKPKISQWEAKELKQERPWLWKEQEAEKSEVRSQNVEAESISPEGSTAAKEVRPTVTIASRVANQAGLAGELNKYFHGLICKDVQQSNVSQWMRGNRDELGWTMVDGVKTIPPALMCKVDSGYYDPRAAVEWFSKWLLPQKKWRIKDGNELDLSHEEKMQRFAERKAQREENIAEGLYRPVAVFNQHLVALGQCVNRALNGAEAIIKKAILLELSRVQSPQSTVGEQPTSNEMIEQAVAEGVRAGIDQVRERVAEGLKNVRAADGEATDEH